MSLSGESIQRSTDEVTPISLLLVAVLSAVLTVLVNFFIGLLPIGAVALCSQDITSMVGTPGVELVGLPFVIFAVLMVVRRIPSLRGHLTRANTVYLYSTALAVNYFANVGYAWDAAEIAVSSVVTAESFRQFIPTFVVAPVDVANSIISGTAGVPWNSVFPIILWNFLLVALFGGIMVSFATIMRREMIDVERLPFPHIMAAHSVLINTENMDKPNWLSRTPFIAGIAIGFFLALPLSGATLFPWFPDIYGWRTNTCGPGSQRIAPTDWPWHLGVAKSFPLYALMLLVPVHDLFSALFFTLVQEIAFFGSFYGLGAYTGTLTQGFCGRAWCSPNIYDSAPLNLAVINSGAVLGLFVSILFTQRNYFLGTLRTAFGKSEISDKDEPMSYKASWILLIAFFVLFIVFFMFTGFSPWMSFVMPLSGLIVWFTTAQLWGRIGVALEPCYQFGPAIVRILAWPTAFRPATVSTDLALAPSISRWYFMTSKSGWGGSLYTALGTYRMSSLAEVKPRNVLKVTVVAMIVAMLVSNISVFAIPAVLGWSKVRKGNPPIDLEGIAMGNFWNRPYLGPLTDVSGYLIAGFLFMVVTRLLYARFLWVPNPIMAIVAWSWTTSLHGAWSAFLVAWVIKYTVLKIGGSKLYEERVVPMVGGFMIGSIVEVLLATLLSFAVIPR